jgi:hypothetical protein
VFGIITFWSKTTTKLKATILLGSTGGSVAGGYVYVIFTGISTVLPVGAELLVGIESMMLCAFASTPNEIKTKLNTMSV